MHKTMSEFLAEKNREKFATNRGTEIHKQLQFLKLNGLGRDALPARPESDRTPRQGVPTSASLMLAEKIRSNPNLAQFWGANSRAEVPIAGFVNGKFYSKRIDRVVEFPSCGGVGAARGGLANCEKENINNNAKSKTWLNHPAAQNSAGTPPQEGNLLFLDYKTDTTRERRNDYERTMKIYASLLRAAYPNHSVSGFILWLHDWELEEII
jgi:hypothetical protein